MSHIAGSTLSAAAGALSVLLIESALKSIVILGAAFALAGLLRCSSAQVRRTLWATALIGAICIPALTAIVPSWRISLLPVTVDGRGGMDRLIGAIPLPAPSGTWIHDDAPLGHPIAAEAPATSWAGVVVVGWWSAGTLLVAAWWLSGVRRVRRLADHGQDLGDFDTLLWMNRLRVKLGIRRAVTLRTHDAIPGPVTFGALRPVVLLPSCADGWNMERRRMVLTHELVHIRRRDWLIQMCGQLVCALYWFNPLAWMAAQRFAIARESACDDDVLRLGARPSDYATHLLEIARSMASWTIEQVAAMARASRSVLEARLASILSYGERRAGGRCCSRPPA